MKRGVSAKLTEGNEAKRKIICLTANLSNGEEVKLHYHEYIELIYLEVGEMNLWIDGTLMNLKTNELAVINLDACHALKAVSKTCSYVSVRFLPDLLFTTERAIFGYKFVYPFLTDNRKQHRIFSSDFVYANEIRTHIKGILEDEKIRDYVYLLSQKVHIESIALAVFRHWKNDYIILNQPDDNSNIAKIMSNAIHFIHENNGNLKASDVAEFCGISTIYFSKSFNSIMLMTYPEYSNLVKIKQAQKELISSNKTLTAIAEELGFSSCSHFIIQFKKVMNCTPAQFRRKWRQIFEII